MGLLNGSIHQSIQFSCSVMCNSLWPHGLQHAILPCTSRTPGACSILSIESVIPSNHLILCHPLLLLPSIFPSVRVFSKQSVLCIRWPKHRSFSFSFSISPFNEYSGLISFIIDWFDHLAVQGTLKSLLQHHSSKLSILWRSTFFIVQLSHPYMTTGKTIALTRRKLVGKVVSLLFNMLSRLVIAFLPRSNRLLISWFHSPSAMILKPKSPPRPLTSNTTLPELTSLSLLSHTMLDLFYPAEDSSASQLLQKACRLLILWLLGTKK